MEMGYRKVKDVIYEIERLEKLKRKLQIDVDERINNKIESNNDAEIYIRSKLHYDDFTSLIITIEKLIDILEDIDVKESKK